jgi:hypothetical protein
MFQVQPQLLVAELHSPHAVSQELLLSSLENLIEWRFGDDMKNSVKWVYLISQSQFLVFIDNENIARKLASETSTELKLNHSQPDVVVEVSFSLVTNTKILSTEYLLVTNDDAAVLDDLSVIQASLAKELSSNTQSLFFPRKDTIM